MDFLYLQDIFEVTAYLLINAVELSSQNDTAAMRAPTASAAAFRGDLPPLLGKALDALLDTLNENTLSGQPFLSREAMNCAVRYPT